MVIYQAHSFASVYEEALHDLMKYPEYVTQPRDIMINEMCKVFSFNYVLRIFNRWVAFI
jgi:hypothetical protein